MKPAYCTQNHGDCQTCSLVNYGMDCANNPITRTGIKSKTLRGYPAAMAAYQGHKGTATVAAVLAQVPLELRNSLTGRQLGMVMSAVDAAYHNGKAAAGAEMINANCVWITGLNRGLEWDEVGAEYKTVTERINNPGSLGYNVTRSVKIKDGALVPRFVV